MHILSIYFGHDGAFSIAQGNKLLMHCQLDRFNRIKHSFQLSNSLLAYLQSLNIIFNFVLFVDLELGNNIEDEFYKDATLIMQLLRDNLTLWTEEVEAE